jgi:glycosyltransferase involved in cell wall biosynthesis
LSRDQFLSSMVSVIITTYNRRGYLPEAVRSVLSQDYENKEVIVVDDGSSDGSHDVLTGLPVRYLWQPNRGISSARNKGIEVSRGEYLAFLDVDDLWLKGKLSIQIGLMEAQGYPVCYTDEVWIRNGKRVNQAKKHRKYSGNIFEWCLPLCIISPSSVVIKRDVFESVGLFDESLPACEDYDMWLRVTSRYPVLFIEKPLIVKRGGHEDQLSRKYEAMDRFRIQSLLKLLEDDLPEAGMRAKAIDELVRKCKIYANGALKRGNVSEGEEYRNLAERFSREAAVLHSR